MAVRRRQPVGSLPAWKSPVNLIVTVALKWTVFELWEWDRQTDRRTDGQTDGRIAALFNVSESNGKR